MVNTDADNNRVVIVFNCVPKQILKQSGDAFRVTRYGKLVASQSPLEFASGALS